MSASDGGHEDVARLLIDKGADVNAKDVHDLTSLMRASQDGHKGAATLLIEKGADVNAKDQNGKTAGDYAAHPRLSNRQI